MKKRLFGYVLLSIIILLANPVSATEIKITPPMADTMVKQSQPDTVQSGNNYIDIDNRTGGSAQDRGLFRFNLTDIPPNSIITDATLYIFSFNTFSGNTVKAYHIYSTTSWTEGGVTWNNQPCGTLINDSLSCNLTSINSTTHTAGSTETRLNIGIKDIVIRAFNAGYDNFSVMLTGSLGSYAEYHAKENILGNQYDPYINITYSPAPNITIDLISPTNNSIINDSTPTIIFRVNSTSSSTINADVFFNDSLVATNSSVNNGTVTSIDSSSLIDSPYTWYINVTQDTFINQSSIYNLNIDTIAPIFGASSINATNVLLNDAIKIDTIVTDINMATVYVAGLSFTNIGGNNWQINTTPQLIGCSTGSCIVTLIANDTAGNQRIQPTFVLTVSTEIQPENESFASFNLVVLSILPIISIFLGLIVLLASIFSKNIGGALIGILVFFFGLFIVFLI